MTNNRIFEEAEDKLQEISDIWTNYIWNYRFCRRKINFKSDQKSNYFADILGFFSDTFMILEKPEKPSNFIDAFESTISFLQAIYLQQDFIEEYHYIFGTGINKGKLKNDENYSINREIRNEVIGHPIRKTRVPTTNKESESCKYCGRTSSTSKKEQVLLSSTLFSNNTNSHQISYLKYHINNDYKFTEENHLRSEIKERHKRFLNVHFDIILDKLKKVLISFVSELLEIQNIQYQISFDKLVGIVEQKFEHILETNYLYRRQHLVTLSSKVDKHQRYKISLELFHGDLETFLNETIHIINKILENHHTKSEKLMSNIVDKQISTTYVENYDAKSKNTEHPSYTYELGKLVSREQSTFDFFIKILKSRCEGMHLVLEEIEYLSASRNNEFEYYSSYIYLCYLLDNNSPESGSKQTRIHSD